MHGFKIYIIYENISHAKNGIFFSYFTDPDNLIKKNSFFFNLKCENHVYYNLN